MSVSPFHNRFNTERNLVVAVMLLGGIGLFLGWRAFWFLTDDAYIAFRYASNSLLGYGYVWNPPPFFPVEGYTSFLWVALLDLVWRTTGVEPPLSANYISLAFSYGTLCLSALMLMRIRWHGRLRHWRFAFLVLLIAFLVFNRTFLAWSSSGLETAMFDFLLILWVYVSLRSASSSRRACAGAITAAALALCRPDGLLVCAGAIAITLLLVFGESDKKRQRQTLLCGLLPLCIVLVHLAWRLSYYGELFPNTYYAKMTGWWPQSGWRYALSFILEYAVWFAAVFICWALVRERRRPPKEPSKEQRSTALTWGAPVVVIGILLLHVGYYTFAVGGDHFEYRVYTHLLPLLFLSMLWSLNSLRLRPSRAITALVVFVLLSMPVPWTRWMLTKDLNTRRETHVLRMPIALHWPQPIRWYAALFDELQSWLIYHHVCMRHQEHKMFWKEQTSLYPSREEGEAISPKGYPVHATLCVGVPSWVFPRVSIIDMFGLNDYVISRAPLRQLEERLMAHSRQPPKGYVESYRPNVGFQRRQLTVVQRAQPMTAKTIMDNERYWRDRLERIGRASPSRRR